MSDEPNDKVYEDLEDFNVDIKINPEFYIHQAIIKAQNALSNPDIKSGFLQYWILIEHVEIICKANKLLYDDYNKELDEFRRSEDYINTKSDEIKNIKITNQKLFKILSRIFSSRTSHDYMRM